MNILNSLFGKMQQIGKALMLPVAVLPAAGILLAVGAAKFTILGPTASLLMESAGGAVFSSLPIIFAIGVALGLSKNDGVSALAATVCFFVMSATLGVLAKAQGIEVVEVFGIETLNTGVFGGILSGILAAYLFNKYSRIQLPEYLGFFAGKRFVPIVSALAAIILGGILSLVWPPIGAAIEHFSNWASTENPMMAFGIYGVVERLLIPFGLHHVWNAPFFFEVGSYTDPITHAVARGEIQRFVAGDPTAGNLAGGYLFKMWGLPAAAMAIWHTAKPENRVKVGGIMVSAAITSFLTGITEPIEFAFMFVAPVLYVIHALLASIAYMLCIALDIKHGMTFSHGFIDYTLLFAQSTHAGWLFIIGPLWALMYYSIFRFAIVKFNLKTPGREEEVKETTAASEGSGGLAQQLVLAFGGKSNIVDLDACITRLRVSVQDINKADEEKLKALGAVGVMVVGNNLQAIFGPKSESLKTDMEVYLNHSGAEAERPANALQTSNTIQAPTLDAKSNAELDDKSAAILLEIVSLLGGKDNINHVESIAQTRLHLELNHRQLIDENALKQAGALGVMNIGDNRLHLIMGLDAEQYAKQMKALLG